MEFELSTRQLILVSAARILENIDMFGFCQTILKIAFGRSYQPKSETKFHGYRVTESNSILLKDNTNPQAIRSRSCQLKKANNELHEIFVTTSPAFIDANMNMLYLARDLITVLVCQNRLCKMQGVLYFENFEQNFPILGKFS